MQPETEQIVLPLQLQRNFSSDAHGMTIVGFAKVTSATIYLVNNN